MAVRVLSVLHLEDDPLDVELAQETLEAGGLACRVCRVETRERYLTELGGGMHDLILADYSLPAFDGLTALDMAQQHRPEIPFILLSGALGEELAVEVLRRGATDYVLKHRLEKLLPSVRRALREVDERQERQRAEEALLFLSEASRTLAESLDWDATLLSIARLSVPRLADWCQVDLVKEDGGCQRLVSAQAHATPEGRPISPLLRPRSSRDLSPLTPLAARIFPGSEAEPGDLLSLGLEHQLCLPLRARDRTLGALTLAWRGDGGPLPGAETDLLEELARRAALALDNARLFRRSQEADRRKDEFLAMLAHELRNPLAPIQNTLFALKARGLERPMEEFRYELLSRQVRHLSSLVDDLLDVSRITRGKIEVRPVPMDFSHAVQSAINGCRALIDSRSHAMVVHLPPGPLPIYADPTRLEQVLCNLLNNAAKYTEPGGRIELWVERQERETSAGREPGVLIRVQDTGIGIASETLPLIFEPFAQVNVSIDRTLGGLGLGLTLVRTLVEMHGGTVDVSSDGVDRGSEFRVWLPVHARERQADATLPRDEMQGDGLNRLGGLPLSALTALQHLNGNGRAAEMRGCSVDGTGCSTDEDDGLATHRRSRRILVVEDNPDGRETLRDLLELWGHSVRTASDGKHGIVAALHEWPEVALVDIGLPGADGYQVAETLRREGPSRPPLLLIALTGYGQPEDRRRALQAGFDAHLVKPLDPELLFQLLGDSTPSAVATGQPVTV